MPISYKPQQTYPVNDFVKLNHLTRFQWNWQGISQPDAQIRIYYVGDRGATPVSPDNWGGSTPLYGIAILNASNNNGDCYYDIDLSTPIFDYNKRYAWAVDTLNTSTPTLPVMTSDFSYFEIIQEGSLQINYTTISATSYRFFGDYTDTSLNAGINRSRFYIIEGSDYLEYYGDNGIPSSNLAYDSGYITSQNLIYAFDGFLPNTTYTANLVVYDRLGNTTFAYTTFTISSNIISPPDNFNITVNDFDGYVKLDLPIVDQFSGVIQNGTIEYVLGKYNYGVKINQDSVIQFTKDISPDGTLNLWVKLYQPYTGDIVKFSDNSKITFEENKFFFKKDTYLTSCEALTNFGEVYNNFFLISISRGSVIIKTVTKTYTILYY